MPYFMKKAGDKWCVYKGTKEDPGEQMHCYSGNDARSKARKYLAALYMHVSDAKDFLLKSYLEMDTGTGVSSDRWIAVSTVHEWDKEGQLFTTEAMDYDIASAKDTGSFPELRLWHVRGFKLGMCDLMTRVEGYAVDYGYWLDTPLANAMKGLIRVNDGTWRISRGFFPVKATGNCPSCDSSLLVGPVHFMKSIQTECPVCKSVYLSPAALKGLMYVATRTYDISITDVPIVPSTAISMWSVSENLLTEE